MPKSKINDKTSYQKALSSLNKQDKPPRILCFLMNMLESYRQSKKMGWSRAWNKHGLKTFQSFQLSPSNDQNITIEAEKLILSLPSLPNDAQTFIINLLHETDRLMGFMFVSEYTEGTTSYESITLSFGAKVKDNPRGRERFDLIFDCPIIDTQAQALSRLRLYADPYRDGAKEPLYQANITSINSPEIHSLFTLLCDYSWQWQEQKDKHWDHWTSNYIDYFDARQIPLQSSHFYLSNGKRIKDAN